jgi:hypothetical protein
MSLTQSTTHREIIVEVISLCKNQITDKATWQSLAARARLAASETSELNMDEECRAAVLTVLAIAQLAISFDKKWLERASSMSIRAISEGWSAYAFGCSKSMVAKFASETAITDLAAKATELALLATAVQPAMVA